MVTNNKAFTLIELLVAIGIIGVLATVILSSLNDARSQGIDAKIMTEMDGVAKRAAVEESSSFTFDTVCGSNSFATSTEILNLFTSINNLASSTLVCNSDTTEYAVSVPLGTTHWCVDSSGSKTELLVALPPGQLSCI